jgi:hypothetical protein
MGECDWCSARQAYSECGNRSIHGRAIKGSAGKRPAHFTSKSYKIRLLESLLHKLLSQKKILATACAHLVNGIFLPQTVRKTIPFKLNIIYLAPLFCRYYRKYFLTLGIATRECAPVVATILNWLSLELYGLSNSSVTPGGQIMHAFKYASHVCVRCKH